MISKKSNEDFKFLTLKPSWLSMELSPLSQVDRVQPITSKILERSRNSPRIFQASKNSESETD